MSEWKMVHKELPELGKWVAISSGYHNEFNQPEVAYLFKGEHHEMKGRLYWSVPSHRDSWDLCEAQYWKDLEFDEELVPFQRLYYFFTREEDGTITRAYDKSHVELVGRATKMPSGVIFAYGAVLYTSRQRRETTLERIRAWTDSSHPYAHLPERHFIVYFGNNIAEVFYNETIFDYRRGE